MATNANTYSSYVMSRVAGKLQSYCNNKSDDSNRALYFN